MSKVVSRIIGGLGMMVMSIILLIATMVLGSIGVILRITVVVIQIVAMFVAGVATIFGIDKIVDLCGEVIDRINNHIDNKLCNKWD